jgi:adenylate kinase
MRIVLFGPPGVGKGTQAQLLSEKYNMVRLSSGDLLREEVSLSSPTGKKVERFLRKGHLVPDDIIYELVDNYLLENKDCDILFDGFPRNLNQARSLEKSLAQLGQTIDIAFEMYLDEDEIVKRLMDRRYCPKCGRIYNSTTNPPKTDGICDADRTKLAKRDDDTADVIRRRLRIYKDETQPLVDYYRSLNVYRRIDARGNQQEVLQRICETVNGYIDNKCRSN